MSMNEGVLTPELILEAAEEVLRRYGPSKATVVDVARALGVSHGSIYRHFADKAALRDAVTDRWLHRITMPLAAIASESGPALPRLRRWFDLLITSKQRRMLDDPELFATYITLTAEARQVVSAHVATLVGQLSKIISDGVASGEFTLINSGTMAVPNVAQALFTATTRFHNPAHAAEWANPALANAFEDLWALLIRGLGVQQPRSTSV
jgi:AcrR family transcriptional regulator